MKHWRDCNCTGSIFVKHIINHLRVGEEVVCKICNKTVAEIAAESSQPGIEAERVSGCTLIDCSDWDGVKCNYGGPCKYHTSAA